MKPRLWRVKSYSAPGFPSPTINFMTDRPLPLGGRLGRRRRVRGLFGLLDATRRDDRDDEVIAVRDDRDRVRVGRNVAHVQLVADREIRDVDLQVRRDVARQALDLDLVQ